MIDFFMSDGAGAGLYSLAFAMYLAASALCVVLSSMTNEKVWNFTAMGMMSLAVSTLILSFRFSGIGIMSSEQQSLAVRSTILVTTFGATWLVLYAIKLMRTQGKK